MVRFAHIADVHLGGWKQQPMQDLNFDSFKKTVDICLKSKLDFVLFAGDLFDSAYPSIEVLKKTFEQFRRLKEAEIPCFIIAGSHDYSVSGKTFLDVLEKTGFCKNVCDFQEKNETIYLNPHTHKNISIYGYPGKKSGLEVQDIRRIKLNDSPGMFKILMLHTTIDKVVGNIPMDSLETRKLPQADYYALGHIHLLFNEDNKVYPGPVFPNNFKELEDLREGSFVIVDTDSTNQIQFIKIPTKKVEKIKINITNALTATDLIISELKQKNLEDKIVLLRIEGKLETGKNSDIKFKKIEEFVMEQGAYFVLRNTHDLKQKETSGLEDLQIKEDSDIEDETIKVHSEKNPSDFNLVVSQLIDALSIEKQEGETSENFKNRVLESSKKILKF